MNVFKKLTIKLLKNKKGPLSFITKLSNKFKVSKRIVILGSLGGLFSIICCILFLTISSNNVPYEINEDPEITASNDSAEDIALEYLNYLFQGKINKAYELTDDLYFIKNKRYEKSYYTYVLINNAGNYLRKLAEKRQGLKKIDINNVKFYDLIGQKKLAVVSLNVQYNGSKSKQTGYLVLKNLSDYGWKISTDLSYDGYSFDEKNIKFHDTFNIDYFDSDKNYGNIYNIAQKYCNMVLSKEQFALLKSPQFFKNKKLSIDYKNLIDFLYKEIIPLENKQYNNIEDSDTAIEDLRLLMSYGFVTQIDLYNEITNKYVEYLKIDKNNFEFLKNFTHFTTSLLHELAKGPENFPRCRDDVSQFISFKMVSNYFRNLFFKYYKDISLDDVLEIRRNFGENAISENELTKFIEDNPSELERYVNKNSSDFKDLTDIESKKNRVVGDSQYTDGTMRT